MKWTSPEKQVVIEFFPTEGAIGVQRRLPHRTVKSVQVMAASLDVSCGPPRPEKRVFDFDNLPATNDAEQGDCRRLAGWRYAVMPGPLVATIGGAR